MFENFLKLEGWVQFWIVAFWAAIPIAGAVALAHIYGPVYDCSQVDPAARLAYMKECRATYRSSHYVQTCIERFDERMCKIAGANPDTK